MNIRNRLSILACFAACLTATSGAQEWATGAIVEAALPTNVRSEGRIAPETLLGQQLAGSRGVIVGGPVEGTDTVGTPLTWWNVDWSSGVDGWCGQATLTLVEGNGRRVLLSWKDNSNNEEGFHLERSHDGGTTWVPLVALPADLQGYIDTWVEPGAEYCYRVRAHNSNGNSDWAEPACITLSTPGTLPNAPSGMGAVEQRPGELVNISVRGWVGVGDELAIGGFVIKHAPLTVLVRAVGPKLTQLGVKGALEDPRLEIIGVPGAVNDNWSGEEIAQAAAKVFAFPLEEGSKDAALLIRLDPGLYTAHVTGVGGTTGIALLEIYQVGN